MGSIKHHPRPAATMAERLAVSTKLQELFTMRLQSERVQFVTLSAALARAEESPTLIFDDLSFRAHRLKGAAATFEFANLAAAAGSLERASHVAATSDAAHTDTDTWEALVALVQVLGSIDENTQSGRHADAGVRVD